MHAGEEKDRCWFHWRPGRESEWVYDDIKKAVDEFKPVPNKAGAAAASWLRDGALAGFPATVTWLYYDNARVEGFFSICSGNFAVREGIKGILPGGGTLKPASEITWLCKHAEAEKDGRWLISRAAVIALEVARVQGNIALIINPYDNETADFLIRKHSFLASARAGQLWLPLGPAPGPH
jgi:hypothetical protein